MRSNVGMRISGLTNTIESGYNYDNIDGMACPDEVGLDDIPEATTLVTQNMVAGTVSTPEKRYSFFRISYRLAGTDHDYVSFANTYGVSSETQQAVYNFLRIEMPSEDRWEFIIEPVSSWNSAVVCTQAAGSSSIRRLQVSKSLLKAAVSKSSTAESQCLPAVLSTESTS